MPLASSLANIHDVQGAIWPANSHQLPLQTNFPGQILSCFSPSILFHVHLVSSRLKRTFLITWRLHCNRHTFHCSLSRSCCSFVLFHLQSRNGKKTRRRSNPRQGKTRFILQLGNNTTVENKFYYLSQFLAALPTDIPEDWRTRSDCRITSPTPKKSESNSNYFPIKCPISFHFTTHGAISSPNESVLWRLKRDSHVGLIRTSTSSPICQAKVPFQEDVIELHDRPTKPMLAWRRFLAVSFAIATESDQTPFVSFGHSTVIPDFNSAFYWHLLRRPTTVINAFLVMLRCTLLHYLSVAVVPLRISWSQSFYYRGATTFNLTNRRRKYISHVSIRRSWGL